MDKEQELEWLEAQKIEIDVDLVAAAMTQLEFLAAVDRRRWLLEGPLLDRAIYRYKVCWLPLLAKHTESAVVDGHLVVPLDCEWVWHCHRLNPVQYQKDCKQFYGRILDNQNVESAIRSNSKNQTEEIWAKLYPDEPFELRESDSVTCKIVGAPAGMVYDLVSAVKRQSSFYYQVSRPSMEDPRFLKEAVARYRGFLHLIKRNQEKSLKRFCVPTYDVDLMWHSHQLHPVSYCNDMVKLLGRVLEHDDTDSDRSEGKKLDVGFSVTTEQFEDMFGLRYWRAGAMYRGHLPAPLTCTTPHVLSSGERDNDAVFRKSNKCLDLPELMVVEVFLEVVDIKNLPTVFQEKEIYVSFTKKQSDAFFSDGGGSLSILSRTGQKKVAGFQCEPAGELILTAIARPTSSPKTSETILGTTSISIEELTRSDSKLSIEKWFELKSRNGTAGSPPVRLRVAASCTVPRRAPCELAMVRLQPFSLKTCFLPLARSDRELRCWTRFVDDRGVELIRVRMRERRQKNSWTAKREVVGMTRLTGKPILLSEFADDKWILNDSDFTVANEITNQRQDGCMLDLKGNRMVKLYLGKKLDFEPKCCGSHRKDAAITAVEFSHEHPYGKAIALLDMESNSIKVNEEWFVLPWIVTAFLFMNLHEKGTVPNFSVASEDVTVGEGNVAAPAAKSGGCGSGCSGNCGAVAESGSCGGGGGGCGGGKCGTVAKSGSCGGACGGGKCGAVAKSGSCGSGCGGGKCGGCGGGKCRTVPQSGGCGGGCGGGNCGAAAKSGGCKTSICDGAGNNAAAVTA